MKLERKQLIELVGALSIVASLVFVAVEIRQSNRIAVATAENEVRAATRELFLLTIEDPGVAALTLKARSGEELSPEEETR